MRAPFTAAALVLVLLAACTAQDQNRQPPVQVLVAKTVITMDKAHPRAHWVAIDKERIAAVGDGAPPRRINGRKTLLEQRFAGKVLMPGFIDPHLHPMIAAVLLPAHFITPEDWDLPSGHVDGAPDRQTYLARLRAALETAPPGQPFITWGWHQLWHGPMDRATLDAIDDTRPVFVWQRSFHELIANSKGMALLGLGDRAAFAALMAQPGIDPGHADYARGYFSETALAAAFRRLAPVVMAPQHLQRGLVALNTMLRRAGVTTISDMATGIFGNFDAEAALIEKAYGQPGVPLRVMLMPYASEVTKRAGSLARAPALIAKDQTRFAGPKVFMNHRVKLLADGAFFSPAMVLAKSPYLDGHKGKWLTPPKLLAQQARTFWDAGLSLHIHVNGDGGLDAVLDAVAPLKRTGVHANQRIVLEHLGISRPGQIKRIAELGLMVSAQPNYVYVTSGKYAGTMLDAETAAHMVRLGELERAHVPVALHSDMTMAPAQPLRLAWIAVNRINMEGQVMAPEERLSVDTALRAITINAARMIGLEDKIGSISPGKSADFAVLEEDPYAVPPVHLKDIAIDGVMFEGRWFAADGAR